jgi:hypothetical protein
MKMRNAAAWVGISAMMALVFVLLPIFSVRGRDPAQGVAGSDREQTPWVAPPSVEAAADSAPAVTPRDPRPGSLPREPLPVPPLPSRSMPGAVDIAPELSAESSDRVLASPQFPTKIVPEAALPPPGEAGPSDDASDADARVAPDPETSFTTSRRSAPVSGR